MDTKLKNISTHKGMKIGAFILVALLIAAIGVQMQLILFSGVNPETLLVKEYKDSDAFSNRVDTAISHTIFLLEDPKDKTATGEKDYYYYISDGKERSFSNVSDPTKEFFTKHDSAFYAFEKGNWEIGENTSPKPYPYTPTEEGTTFYIAFPEDFIQEGQSQWQEERNKIMPYGIGIVICSLVSFILIVYLIIVTGKKPGDNKIHLQKIDGLYLEILFAIIPMVPILFFPLLNYFHYEFNSYMGMGNGLRTAQKYFIGVSGVVTAFGASIYGLILLSLVRRLKAGIFLKNSFVYKVFYRIYDFFKSLLDGRRFEEYSLTKALFYRQLMFIAISGFLVFLTFVLLYSPLVLFPPILEILFIYWYVKGNNKTYEEINKGFNESLEEQMKSERMKIDLVTNVSHDLKTPLTSIISYVDLLSKEEDLSQGARDYVKILSSKSNRLKQIVSDLFDLAKSTSGDIKLDLETLDMKKLIQQTLGDMGDKIEASNITIKTNLPEEPIYIESDGKKLYRVFQNVLDNALKYSHPGTRVYVDLEEVGGKAMATIKNTANYEIDFTPEEILQRFNRGDKSRTTEGSGLGLSIGKSFTNISGGNFDVQIDGDLFKVMISFKKVEDKEK